MEYKVEYEINEEWKVVYLVKDEVTVGKLPDCDIELHDNTVSRMHCKFVRRGGAFHLVDLKSTNGTFVNGRRVEEKSLVVGDHITVGRTQLTFLAVASEENYNVTDDQRISMIVPLAGLEEQGRQEKTKSEELRLLSALTDLGKNLITSQNLEECFLKVGQLIHDFIGPEKVYVFHYDEKQNDLHLKYSHDQKGRHQTPNISKTIALKAIHEKAAILSSNARDDVRFEAARSVILFGITAVMSVPIWTKDSIYGLIYVDTTSFSHIFTQKDLEIMSTIANFAGLSIEGFASLEKLNRERKLRFRLERYHSPGVVSRLLQFLEGGGEEIASYRESEATVMFMDIVRFTSRVEKMNPVEVGIFLNNFFTEMTEIIFRHNGTLDKFIGDAIMAVFGVPLEMKNHAEYAVRAALEMMEKLAEINRTLPEEEKIQVRIGINSGKLISGDFGSPKRLDYTVLGNTVNIASRLEAAAAPNEILVSDSVFRDTQDLFPFSEAGERSLYGISRPVPTFRVHHKGEA